MTLIIQKCDIMTAIIKKDRDFPGGPVVWSPPWNAEEVGLLPGQGARISQVVGQLGPWPQLLSPCALHTTCHN